MAEQKDKGSSSERAPKSLLAVEPPTGGHWNPPKKKYSTYKDKGEATMR